MDRRQRLAMVQTAYRRLQDARLTGPLGSLQTHDRPRPSLSRVTDTEKVGELALEPWPERHHASSSAGIAVIVSRGGYGTARWAVAEGGRRPAPPAAVVKPTSPARRRRLSTGP